MGVVNKPIDIKLLYFPGCPNVEAAKANLAMALKKSGFGKVPVTEINVFSPGTPEKFKNYPSPSVLINDRDVEEKPQAGTAACRIYPGGGGVPATEKITALLRKSKTGNKT